MSSSSSSVGIFPFLFGGTFIEGFHTAPYIFRCIYFPSFSEGLSLRAPALPLHPRLHPAFPFLFGGTFIEGRERQADGMARAKISLPFRRDFH